jgi:hypothetical protein
VTQTDLRSLVLGAAASIREVLAALDAARGDRVFLVDGDGRLCGCVDERVMRRGAGGSERRPEVPAR